MFCYYCGKRIDDDSAFCFYCGKSLPYSSESIKSNQTEAVSVKKAVLPDSNDYSDESAPDDTPKSNFVMHIIGPSDPEECLYTITKGEDEDEIVNQETTASKKEKTFEYALENGKYTIYVDSYSREVTIKKGIIVDFTYDCSGFFNKIFINERPETEKNNESASKERKTTTKTAAKKKTSDKTLFTLHLIGPSKPVQIKYHISSFNLQIIDKGTTYALSTDNKLTYRLNPGKYEVRINRYSRIVNVGSASDVDFIFDCSHRTSSIQIIGDIKG